MSLRYSLNSSQVWLALSTLVAASVLEGVSQENAPVVELDIPRTHHKGMVKISPQRHALDPNTATLCRVLDPSEVNPFERGPHKNAAVLVYVNQKVVDHRKANAEGGEFPVGSIFLKDKYADLKARDPHLATRMKRVSADGDVDDWEFSVISLPDGKSIGMTANEKAACADCHSKFVKQGFVSHYSFNLLEQLVSKAAGKGDGKKASEDQLSVLPATHLVGLEKLSPARHSLSMQMSALCMSPTAIHGPHDESAILVYANQKVIDHRREKIGNELPVGSVLLKEKYADLKVRQPHLATIMRRTRDEGGVEDWDFSVISLPDGKPTLIANEKAACADCHSNFAKSGFISHYTDGLLRSVGKEGQAEAGAARPNVNSKGFLRIAAEAENLREKRLVTPEEFAAYAKREQVVVLDARSYKAFAREHVKGAVNLPYTEFTPDALAKVIPSKSTQVLIYCDNNVRYGPNLEPLSRSRGMAPVTAGKRPAFALNIPTFITLYGYGYRNLYELEPSVTPGQTVIDFVGGKD